MFTGYALLATHVQSLNIDLQPYQDMYTRGCIDSRGPKARNLLGIDERAAEVNRSKKDNTRRKVVTCSVPPPEKC